MKRLLLGLLALAQMASAQELLRVHVQTTPSDTLVTIEGENGKADAGIDHTGSVYLMKARTHPGKLRFRSEGYHERLQPFTYAELQALPEDPANPGVRLYPPVALSPQGGWLLFGLRYYGYWLAPVGLVLGALAWRRHQDSQRRATHLAQVEKFTQTDGGDPMLGRRLDQYLLTQRLGSGGMATVYRAIPFDTLDESQAVAIKLILEENRDAEFYNRFGREVEVTRSLNHPNTVRLFGWGEQDGLFFLIMELVQGQPLRPPPQGFSLAEFEGLVPGLLAGLIYAHELGIVHRDLKPDNLMRTHSGEIKVMDFGLARSHEMKTVTATGTALGTPAYMPPEQILGHSPTPLSDQYSLGVTFYEWLCGRRPFEYIELMALIQAQMNEEPMPLSLYNPNISLDLEQVVMRMICKQPQRRFANLKEVQTALDEAFAST